MSIEYYVWDTEAEAQAALDYINNSGWFPIASRNVQTGEVDANILTTCWLSEVSQRLDSKWCFKRVPAARMDALGVPQEDRDAFLSTFNPTIEVWQDGWFPTEE